MNRTINIGDYFWEYNNGLAYERRAHSQAHIDYFWKRHGEITFLTLEGLRSRYPDAKYNYD